MTAEVVAEREREQEAEVWTRRQGELLRARPLLRWAGRPR